LTYITAGNAAIYLGIPTFQFSFSPRIYWKFLDEANRFPDYRYYALHGAKYLLSTSDLSNSILQPDFQIGPVRVYRIVGAREWVGGICSASTHPEFLGLPAKPGRLPDLPLEITRRLSKAWSEQQADCAHGLSDISLLPNQDRLTWLMTKSAPRLLLINLPPYRAWRLELAGQDIPLFNLSDSQIIAIVPEGLEGVATLTYVPTFYFERLWSGFLAGLILLAAFVAVSKRPPRYQNFWKIARKLPAKPST
jgi:hypothetical protein